MSTEEHIAQLTAQIAALQAQPSAAPPPPLKPPKVPGPSPFSGAQDDLDCCRQDISLVSNPPIGMSFGPWNVSQSLPVKGATTNAFLLGFTEILLSKSAPNLDALIPLNRAKSYDPNDPTFTFIPILEGEIWNLPVLCLHTFAG